MRVLLVMSLGLYGCQSAATGGQTVPRDGGGGGADAGAATEVNFNLAGACPDYQPPVSGKTCRNQADCTQPGTSCMLSTTRFSYPPCIAGMQPPPAECQRDLDCPPGQQCHDRRLDCPQYYSKCLPSMCTPTSCGQGARCLGDGRCEALPCTDGSWTCRADQRCSPDPKALSRDANGCVPRPCNDGYACPSNQLCDLGAPGTDAHGCRAKTCAEGVLCPAWQRCRMTPPPSSCEARPCKVDADCPCGLCLDQTFCAPGPGLCLGFPSFPP